MKRRKFVYATAAAAGMPFLSGASSLSNAGYQGQRDLYELRVYEMKFRANRGLLENYLTQTLRPALEENGLSNFTLMEEIGMSDPASIYALMSYPTTDSYMKALTLDSDPAFLARTAEYSKIGPDQALYNRYASSLLLAFTGMPQMKGLTADSGLLELRTYEGYSEDAVRRKIAMFNEGEIDLFLETGLHPVFFGEMVAGPYRPCLTYMLQFRDMEERDTNWKQFIDHPGWKAMSGMEEYANTVSNIRRTFLRPIS